MGKAIERLADELGQLSSEEWVALAKRHPRTDEATEAAGSDAGSDAASGSVGFGHQSQQQDGDL